MCACVCVVGLLFVCSFSFFPSVSLLHVMYILSCFICTHVVCTCLILFILCHYFVSFTLLHCFINVCIRVCLCVCPDEELSGYSCLHRCPYGGIVEK